MKKSQDLQPLFEYFGMLRKYEEKGYLQAEPEKHEAYITRAAYLTLLGEDSEKTLCESTIPVNEVADISRRLLTYVAYQHQLNDYIEKPFALHVLKEDAPFDPLYTVLFSRRRVWWKLWLGKADHIEIISY